ncbi:MAG TPA: ATP-binding cassette domain-containing protein [Chloroflexota bacterium]|jgi:ABC-2 type transport system ATP-binding protein|nr:ATP-binding cassette domain-containing protein [Chloroflexota bacterium]
MPTSIAAIEVAGLVKTYKGGVRALDGLDLQVQPGTVFGLLGPNGAGKSTTVKVLTTLTSPDSGTARVAGFDVVRQANQVRHAIGYVPQKSSLDPDLTGRENMILQGQLYNLGGRQLKARAAELLDRFDLSAAADRLARGYSGGMQRKLEVAMGLVHHPRVLFLDEPTTGLDPEARASMWEEIDRLVADEGVTILLTTHYLEEADKLASRLAIIDHGRVVAEGTPEELKAELHGDTIQVELEGSPESGMPAVNRVAGLRDVTIDGRVVRARADRGAAAVPAVLAALEADGAKVASVTISRPSLDDVYLRYAGRAFTEADKEQAA